MKAKKNNISQDDLDFISETRAALLLNTPRRARTILWCIFLFFVILLVWISQAKLDKIIEAQGKVMTSNQINIIQNLEGGIISDIYVKTGERVYKDQILLKIDSTKFMADLKDESQKESTLRAKKARLNAELSNKNPVFPEDIKRTFPQIVERELAQFEDREKDLKTSVDIFKQKHLQTKQQLIELENTKKTLQMNHELLKKELDITVPLARDGVVPKVEMLKLQREVNRIKGELRNTELSIPRVKSSIEEAQHAIDEVTNKFMTNARTELNEVLSAIDSINQNMIITRDRVHRTLVRSPVDGVIKTINVSNVGGVIQPGMEIMEIVPSNDTLIVEAKITPDKIAFIRPGLPVQIKLTSYDFVTYGGISGTVSQIGVDTITTEKGESYYPVTITTETNYVQKNGKRHEIMSGMQAEADIIIGKNTILQYLMKPILRAAHESLTEK